MTKSAPRPAWRGEAGAARGPLTFIPEGSPRKWVGCDGSDLRLAPLGGERPPAVRPAGEGNGAATATRTRTPHPDPLPAKRGEGKRLQDTGVRCRDNGRAKRSNSLWRRRWPACDLTWSDAHAG